jgi:kumamolisin
LSQPARSQRKIICSQISRIAAKSVSILIASGDKGAKECGPGNGLHPSFPATSPFATAVGGTHLIANGGPHSLKLTIKSQTGWSGSGGGLSDVFATPSYQKPLGAPSRAVPDVAADADPATGVVILLGGFTEEVGGTSASTPIWAGFVSLINQARFAKGKDALGQLNPHIYKLPQKSNFDDVVEGCDGGYCAVPGYDLVTGWGSPVMNKLLPALAAQP